MRRSPFFFAKFSCSIIEIDKKEEENMLTLIVVCLILFIVGLVIMTVEWMVQISPLLLLIVALPLIDYLVFKLLFRKRKKK